MSASTLLFLLLLLACPLIMLFMHRGGHGHAQGDAHDHAESGAHGHGGGCGHGQKTVSEPDTLPELRRRREELDAEIERLEAEQTPREPVAS